MLQVNGCDLHWARENGANVFRKEVYTKIFFGEFKTTSRFTGENVASSRILADLTRMNVGPLAESRDGCRMTNRQARFQGAPWPPSDLAQDALSPKTLRLGNLC